MRSLIGSAALVIALGFSLRASAAPIVVTGNASQSSSSASKSFFTKLSLPSFVTPTNKLTSFFPTMPSLSNANGFATSSPIPLTNGQANKEYFKMFGLQAAHRAQ